MQTALLRSIYANDYSTKTLLLLRMLVPTATHPGPHPPNHHPQQIEKSFPTCAIRHPPFYPSRTPRLWTVDELKHFIYEHIQHHQIGIEARGPPRVFRYLRSLLFAKTHRICKVCPPILLYIGTEARYYGSHEPFRNRTFRLRDKLIRIPSDLLQINTNSK